jgi:hypothetical protein
MWTRQNDSRLDELASKVSALRGITVDIYDSARDQHVIDSTVRLTLCFMPLESRCRERHTPYLFDPTALYPRSPRRYIPISPNFPKHGYPNHLTHSYTFSLYLFSFHLRPIPRVHR